MRARRLVGVEAVGRGEQADPPRRAMEPQGSNQLLVRVLALEQERREGRLLAKLRAEQETARQVQELKAAMGRLQTKAGTSRST